MRRFIALFAVFALLIMAFSGCGTDVSPTIDDTENMLEQKFSEYLKDHDVPKSVLDTLDMMLDNYVSGLSRPPSSSISSTPVDPGDADAQSLISNVSGTVTSESELVDLIHDSLLNLNTDVTFEVSGNWFDADVLYRAVFDKVHDVYMIDAFGLYAYVASWTTNGAGNLVYSLQFEFIDDCSVDEIRDMRQKIEDRCKEIVRDLDLANKTDYEKIVAIDQFLCDNVYYPNEPYIAQDHTPYGTLFSGRAVCEGYARTVKILCDLCGMDCYYVVGYCNNDPINGGHGWNLVKVDGDYYQLDVTWNDASASKDYLLVTDDFMTLSRAWERGNYPASAKSPFNP